MSHIEKKAVAYVMVSTDEQVRNGVSLEAQAASIEDWARNASIRLVRRRH